MKKVIAFLLLVFQIENFCFAKSKANKIEIRYLMWDLREKSYAVYENEELISTLSMLNGRKIFGIKFDKANPDFILFAEQNENVYSVKQIDFITNEETTLFSFEYPMYRFRTFTRDSLFWFDKCEKNREPHILYEYNSRTEEIKKLFEVEDILDKSGERYESRYISSVLANDGNVFFFMEGGFVPDSGTFVVDRKSGEAKRITDACIKMNDAGGMAILSEFAITDGKSMKLYRDEYSARNLAFSKDSCTIMDLDTLEEVHCDFKKRYEGQGGRLILLSDNYLLVPLAIKPFRDSIKNGLFLSIWTVCYTVFDISKNRRVFEGLVTRTNELKIIDAILMDSADKSKL